MKRRSCRMSCSRPSIRCSPFRAGASRWTDSALAPGEPSSEADFPETVLWDRYQVKAGDCPRIAAEFLAEQRVLLGDLAFRREYLCEFVAPGIQVFDRELPDSAFDDGLLPYNGGSPLWR